MKNNERQPEPAERDDIARLIRAAGKRPAVPTVRALRVKTAVQTHWSQEIKRRRRRRYLWYTAAVSAAAALLLLVGLPGLRPVPVPDQETRVAGKVESFVGECWSSGSGNNASKKSGKLHTGIELVIGSSVTTGDTGRIALRLASGYSVKLDTGSSVRLVAPGIVALDAGALYVDSEHSGENAGTLRIRTPLGTIQEIGTRYEVRLHQGLVRVRVREGLVILDDGSRAHQIQAASELTLDEDATVTTQRIETDGVGWDWTATLSAVPELKGLTAREYLEWAARERGWHLVFATDQLARSASEIVLGGSAVGLTLDESLDAVLPACGMSYRLEGNQLIISPVAGVPAR